MTKAPTWAVASDFLSVVKTDDGFGIFPTELDAVNRQIDFLQGEIEPLKKALGKARRRRIYLRKKQEAEHG